MILLRPYTAIGSKAAHMRARPDHVNLGYFGKSTPAYDHTGDWILGCEAV